MIYFLVTVKSLLVNIQSFKAAFSDIFEKNVSFDLTNRFPSPNWYIFLRSLMSVSFLNASPERLFYWFIPSND